MAYFNHAFKQTFTPASVEAAASQTTASLNANEIGVFNPIKNGVSFDLTGAITGDKVFIAQGNPNTTDTLGGNAHHGGYSESWKSKIINKKYVRFMGYSVGAAATAPALNGIMWDTCFDCGKDYSLRVDLKGDPILRTLNRNAYKVMNLSGYCCTVTNQTKVDPAAVAINWATQFNDDPIMSKFATATVAVNATAARTGGSATKASPSWTALTMSGSTGYLGTNLGVGGVNKLDLATYSGNEGARITITYDMTETSFNVASFDSRDHWKQGPVTMVTSVLDESGDPCNLDCVTWDAYQTGVTSGGFKVGTPRKGAGENVMREVLLSDRYRQHPYSQGNKDSNRFNEIEIAGAQYGGYGIALGTNYNWAYLLHTVPRFNNPTGTFDNDQYLIQIAYPASLAASITGTNGVLTRLATWAGATIADMDSNFSAYEGFIMD